jgi:hypothetical protein
MTSFVHLNYSTEHPGVARAESVLAAAGSLRRNFDATKSLATMLLAALVAALVVVADQMIDTWADGHLLAAWVALWSVAFVALALLAPTARRLAANLSSTLKEWSVRSAQARTEELYWASAQNDPRVMAELQAAITRSESVRSAATASQVKPAKTVSSMARLEARKMGGSYLRSF